MLPVQYPQGLGELFSAPMSGGLLMSQFENAQQAHDLNRHKTLADMYMQQEKHPLEMQLMGGQARDLHSQADARELKTKFDKETYDPRVKSELSKIAAQLKDDDYKNAETAIKQALMSRDPQERAEAEQMWGMMSEIRKMREEAATKHKNEMEKVRLMEAGDTERTGMNNATTLKAARINAAGGKSSKAPPTEAEIIAKGGFERAAAYYDAKAFEAERNGEEQAALVYRAQANKMKTAFERAKTLAGQQRLQGQPDMGALADVPTLPGVTPEGFTPSPQGMQGTVQPEGTPPATNAEIFKKSFGAYEPDKYDYRIGPNGKPQRKLKSQ